MKIADLFNVEYGSKEYSDKKKLASYKGRTVLISAKGEDNGVYGLYDIEPKYTNPIITIPRVGTIGRAFVQHRACCVDDNCLILSPKAHLTIEELYQVALQLRQNTWKYKYGRQITPERIKKQEIVLCAIQKQYTTYKENRKYTQIKPTIRQEIVNIKLLKLNNICNIEKKTAPSQDVINLDGDVPYITATSKNNGASNFTDEASNFNKNCLTVAMNGSVCEVFYQNRNFITNGDTAVLYLKDEYKNLGAKEQLALLLYVGAVLKNEKWKYNYCRKLSKDKLQNTAIPVPVIINNKLDINYIMNILNNILLYNKEQ